MNYYNTKDYKQLYTKLWNEMYNKVNDMQKLLADADKVAQIIQYENKEFDGRIHRTTVAELFGKDKTNKAEE